MSQDELVTAFDKQAAGYEASGTPSPRSADGLYLVADTALLALPDSARPERRRRHRDRARTPRPTLPPA